MEYLFCQFSELQQERLVARHAELRHGEGEFSIEGMDPLDVLILIEDEEGEED